MEVGGDQSSSSNADKSCVAEAKHTTLNDEEFDDHVIDSDEYWEVMFERLKRFKEENGHCLVPSKHHADIQLSKWVTRQRRQWNALTKGRGESAMTPERAERLTSLGFRWSAKDPSHVPWEHRYHELASFVTKYGHSQVPIGWENNIQLANWVSTQRQEYKLLRKGLSSRLTEDRIEMLNRINFVWEAQRGGPRRKRRATVEVPSKPNPVAGSGPPVRTALSSRGRLSHGSIPVLASTYIMPRIPFNQMAANSGGPIPSQASNAHTTLQLLAEEAAERYPVGSRLATTMFQTPFPNYISNLQLGLPTIYSTNHAFHPLNPALTHFSRQMSTWNSFALPSYANLAQQNQHLHQGVLGTNRMHTGGRPVTMPHTRLDVVQTETSERTDGRIPYGGESNN